MNEEQSGSGERDTQASLLPVAHVDPTDLLRAMLAISPEDAAAVREDAAEAMKPGEPTREQ